MKCGAGQHKLKVRATNGRYIIRNGIISGAFCFMLDEQKILLRKRLTPKAKIGNI